MCSLELKMLVGIRREQCHQCAEHNATNRLTYKAARLHYRTIRVAPHLHRGEYCQGAVFRNAPLDDKPLSTCLTRFRSRRENLFILCAPDVIIDDRD